MAKEHRENWDKENITNIRVKLYGKPGAELLEVLDKHISQLKDNGKNQSRNSWITQAIIEKLLQEGIPAESLAILDK